jgi:hypothetical protein
VCAGGGRPDGQAAKVQLKERHEARLGRAMTALVLGESFAGWQIVRLDATGKRALVACTVCERTQQVCATTVDREGWRAGRAQAGGLRWR